jgi:predicted naringenin-chalcone synthase
MKTSRVSLGSRSVLVWKLGHNFQLAMQQQFTQVVEDRLDRRVVAYLSQVHTDPDIAVELFMLEPTGRSTVAEYEQEFPTDDDAP